MSDAEIQRREVIRLILSLEREGKGADRGICEDTRTGTASEGM